MHVVGIGKKAFRVPVTKIELERHGVAGIPVKIQQWILSQDSSFLVSIPIFYNNNFV